MSRCTLRQRLRYKFDNFMTQGGSSVFVSLTLVFLGALVFVVLVRGAIFLTLGSAATEREVDFFGQVYTVFLGMTDPGNMNQDVDSHWSYKVPAILAGLIGVVIFSALIAAITTSMDQKLQALKKGHSKVVEDDHTLILGWNNRVLEILRELTIANESEDDPCVVILSERDKEEMDDTIHMHLGEQTNTRVVTRSGHISSLVNLDIVSLQTCKSVIVLAYCGDSATPEEKEASDIRVIKTILGATACRGEGQQLNIVAEIFSPRGRRVAEEISPGEVTTIDAQEILAKILVQTSRSVGLSVVYGEALSFDGCELYFHGADWGDAEFGRLQFHFPDGVPIGIRREDGELLVNPPIDTAMREGDDVLILAEDDSTIEFRGQPVAAPTSHTLRGGRIEHDRERELIIGWNAKVPTLIREYADYVLDGSSIDVMVDKPDLAVQQQIDALNREQSKITIELIDKDPLKSQSLVEVTPSSYDNIIILSQGGDAADPETTDAETIVILLLIRQVMAANGNAKKAPKLITEVMDSANQSLVSRAGVNDFIISNRFVSTILAQISEEPDIKSVYDDLFSEDGSEIYLKPASLYFETLPLEVSFADMMAIAQARAEVCIGIKITAWESEEGRNFGVKLIPEKNTHYTIQPDDCLVVVAEDDT